MCRPTDRTGAPPILRRAWVAAFLLCCATAAPAQGLQRSRLAAVNDRQVLEIRMGNVPGNGTLRTLVITAGPVAGSTSLLAAAAPLGQVLDAGTPMPFAVVVNAGSLYSLGGGCTRAGELNFPYIDGLQFRIVRYTGTTQTIVTPPAVAGQFEGVNCTTSADGQAVFYALASRTTGRLEVWREGAGNAFTRVHLGTRAIRLPFAGGARPQIARMFRRPPVQAGAGAKGFDSAATPYEAAYVLALQQEQNGQIWVDVVNTTDGLEHGICQVGSRNAGAPPFELFLAPDYVVGDLDGDGDGEVKSLGPTVDGLCEVGSRTVTLGAFLDGNGYTWTGYAVVGNTVTKEYWVMNGSGGLFLQPASVTPSASPFAGRGGPFHGAYVGGGEFDRGFLAVGAATPNSVIEYFAALPAQAPDTFSSSFEPALPPGRFAIEVAPPPR